MIWNVVSCRKSSKLQVCFSQRKPFRQNRGQNKTNTVWWFLFSERVITSAGVENDFSD
jgi:hypothetical protein